MHRTIFVLALFLSFSVAYAQPQITSVTPGSGPMAGGTPITIHGTGFDTTCPPDLLVCNEVTVSVGSLPATSFRVVNSSTIEAVTPASLPGTVPIAVRFPRGATVLANAFTYTGEVSDAFDRILLPIFVSSGPFVTSFSMFNSGTPDVPVFLSDQQSFLLKPHEGTTATNFAFDGDPGRLIYVPKGSFARIAASLRVFDSTRLNESAGTRIPVVPESDFRSDLIALVDVPGDRDSNFRYTLRIYSLDPGTSVHIAYWLSDGPAILKQQDVTLFDPISRFYPGYAQISDFHPMVPVRIEITPTTPGKRIWAFVSVTNNSTQQITVVAPH